jgi:hypothetical protein
VIAPLAPATPAAALPMFIDPLLVAVPLPDVSEIAPPVAADPAPPASESAPP